MYKKININILVYCFYTFYIFDTYFFFYYIEAARDGEHRGGRDVGVRLGRPEAAEKELLMCIAVMRGE